jgi:hypothetical protein
MPTVEALMLLPYSIWPDTLICLGAERKTSRVCRVGWVNVIPTGAPSETRCR